MKTFICGCVRNCEPHIDGVFDTINRIRTVFNDIHIIVAYDQSNDKSLLKLSQHKRIYGDKMDVLINRNPLSLRRTENIANARNAILDRMRVLRELEGGDECPDWRIFIMMDFDDVCSAPPNLDVLTRTLNREAEWDSVSFNRPGYYDVWAVSLRPFVYSAWGWDDPREVVNIMRNYVVEKLNGLKPDEWLKCESAFNGFALYKTSIFLKCRYNWRRPLEFISVADLNANREAVGFRRARSPLDKQTDEPDCEHRWFHMSAIRQYGARIWISPEFLFSHAIYGHA